jgi:hypothetical protein
VPSAGDVRVAVSNSNMSLLRVLAIGVVTTGWAAWLVAAPAVLAARSGGAALAAAGLTYGAGAVICHQQVERSFKVAGTPMPVCARCFGLYAGASAGAVAVLLWVLARGRAAAVPFTLPLTRLRGLVLSSGVPTLVLWTAEHVAGTPIPTDARALAAVPFGAAIAALVALWAGGAAFEDTQHATAIH